MGSRGRPSREAEETILAQHSSRPVRITRVHTGLRLCSSALSLSH